MLDVNRLIVVHTLTGSLYLFCVWSSESSLKYCKCAPNDPARDTMCCSGESKKCSFLKSQSDENSISGKGSLSAWEITHCIDILSEPSTAEYTEVKQINPFTKVQAAVNRVHNVCKVNSMSLQGALFIAAVFRTKAHCPFPSADSSYCHTINKIMNCTTLSSKGDLYCSVVTPEKRKTMSAWR